MKFRKDIVLGDVGSVIRTAVKDGWFDDTRLNRLLGFGSDLASSSRIRMEMKRSLEQRSDSAPVWGLYTGSKPVGFARIALDGPCAALSAYFPRKYQGTNIPVSAMKKVLDELFSRGAKRVEIQVLEMNRPARRFLRKVGFRQEGVRLNAHWVGKQAYHLVMYSLLKKDFNRITSRLRHRKNLSAAVESMREDKRKQYKKAV